MKKYIPYYLIAGIVLVILSIFPKWTVDDAYISYRYSENLAQHGQFTFNVGEDPVEGYTGVLMPLAISLALSIGLSPEPCGHLIGILSFIAALIFFYKILTRLCSPPSVRFSMMLLFASAPFLYTHVFSGLETICFTALLLVSAEQLHSLVRLRSVSFIRYAALALSLLALSLCRPEGVAYAAIVVCVLSGTGMFRITSRRAFIVCFSCLLVIPGALYFIWRWQHYGYLLPNTFYAKQVTSLSVNSFNALMWFCAHYLFFPAVCVAITFIASLDEVLASFRKKRFAFRAADLLTLGALLLFCLIIVTQYLRSHLAMNYSHRFYVPLYPVALLFLGWLLSASFETTRLNSHSRPWTHAAIMLVLCLALLTQTACHVTWLFRKEMPYASAYMTRQSEMHRPAGLYLRDRVPDSEWLIVHYDAGAIPYYSKLKTVDFGNLNDEFLAHNKLASQRSDRVNYFFSKQPGAVVFTSYKWNQISHGSEAATITSDPRFGQYALVRKYGNTAKKKYYQFVFLRRDLLEPGEEIGIDEQTIAGDDAPARLK